MISLVCSLSPDSDALFKPNADIIGAVEHVGDVVQLTSTAGKQACIFT